MMEKLEDQYGADALSEALEVSESGFAAHRGKQDGQHWKEDADLRVDGKGMHVDQGRRVPLIYWCRRLLGLNDAAQVQRILREMAFSLLNEIKDLPEKVTDPNWLDESDGQDDGDRIHPASGQEIRTEQAKAKTRRQNKTATEAKRRARR